MSQWELSSHAPTPRPPPRRRPRSPAGRRFQHLQELQPQRGIRRVATLAKHEIVVTKVAGLTAVGTKQQQGQCYGLKQILPPGAAHRGTPAVGTSTNYCNSQRYFIAENSGQGNSPASCCQTRGCEYLAKMLGRQHVC